VDSAAAGLQAATSAIAEAAILESRLLLIAFLKIREFNAARLVRDM
jgi:hypothetical protein